MFRMLGCNPSCCERAAEIIFVHVEAVDAPRPVGGASLDWAAEAGNTSLVDVLLKSKANPNEPRVPLGSFTDVTPLVLACKAGHEAVVTRLLEEQALDVNACTKNEEAVSLNCETALHWAVRGRGPSFVHTVRALCSDTRVAVDASTSTGLTPLMMAAKSEWANARDIAQELLEVKSDANRYATDCEPMRMNAMTLAIASGRADVLGVLLDSGHMEINESFYFRKSTLVSYLHLAVECRMSDIVLLLLECEAYPDFPYESDSSAIQRAVAIDAVESTYHLLLKGADTTGLFSPLLRLQLLGDSAGVQDLLLSMEAEETDVVPALHAATLYGEVPRVKEEILALQSKAKAVLDGGNLPAAYYAMELGLDNVARVLLVEAHGLPNRAVDLAIAVTNVSPAPLNPYMPGMRMHLACKALLTPIAATCGNRALAQGLMDFLLPWCGSAAALEFFTMQPVHFFDLCSLCQLRCQELCASIDSVISRPVLEKLSTMTFLEESSEPILQDSGGLLPELKFGQADAGVYEHDNYEVCATRTLSVLAFALDDIFQEDMRMLLKPLDVHELSPAPPKSFERMMNKLMSPAEHGSHTFTRPRCMRNLDVLRLAATVRDVRGAEQLIAAVQGKYDVLKVTNNYDPQGPFGGCRYFGVHFVYDSKVSFRSLFGESTSLMLSSSDGGSPDAGAGGEFGEADRGRLWQDYVATLGDTTDTERCLEPLWRIGAHEPEATVMLVAELRVMLEAYAERWVLLNHLDKISRCHTPAELVRRYAPSRLRRQSSEDLRKMRLVSGLARSIRESQHGDVLEVVWPEGHPRADDT